MTDCNRARVLEFAARRRRAARAPEVFFSLVTGPKDTTPQAVRADWAYIKDIMRRPRLADITRARYQALSKKEKKAAKVGPGFIFATFKGERNIKFIDRVFGLAGDIDNTDGTPLTADDIAAKLAGLRFLIYSTFSHTPDAPRWRFMVPFSRAATREEAERAWDYMQEKFNGALDDSKRPPSHLFYTPACPKDAAGDFIFREGDGAPFDVDALPPPKPKPNPTRAAKLRARAEAYARGPVDWERVRDAVFKIPSDERDVWLRVGMTLHSTGDARAESLWSEWASYSDKFDARDQRRTWESFDIERPEGEAVTLGSLFHLAEENGWTPPRVRAGEGAPEIRETDVANAKRFAADHGRRVRFTIERGWFSWDGRRWAPDEKAVAVQALAKQTALALFDEIRNSPDQKLAFAHARRSQSRQAIDAMVYLARSEPGIPARLTDFDADPMAFNCANGTLDLRTGKLRPHDPLDLITAMSPVVYDADATCKLFDVFLRQILNGDEALVAYLQRVIGYLLTGLTIEQVLHFFHGLGANGKSTLCEIILAIMGDYAIVCAPELVIAKRHAGIPNDIARLRGVRVALMNETSQGSRFDEAKLKDLTGGDSLTGRFLHQEFFDFRPSHKLIIRGNHKPAITGTDEGIWRRLRLVPFTVQIPGAEQDKHLVEKLRAELPGILRWAVEGCLQWQREGLRPPACVLDAGDVYRAESDTLGRFIEERCEARSLAQIKSSAFFAAYQDFCQRAGERWIPARDLPMEMQRRGFEHKRGGQGVRLYLGIELRELGLPWDR